MQALFVMLTRLGKKDEWHGKFGNLLSCEWFNMLSTIFNGLQSLLDQFSLL